MRWFCSTVQWGAEAVALANRKFSITYALTALIHEVAVISTNSTRPATVGTVKKSRDVTWFEEGAPCLMAGDVGHRSSRDRARS
jgi:hypothetical protein